MGFRISVKSKRSPLLFFFGFLVSIFLVIVLSSGCFESPRGFFNDYNRVEIQSVDIMSTPKGEGTLLTVTPYIRNDQDTDSSMLSIKVKVTDSETRLIVAEKNMDMGYIKAHSTAYNSLSLEVEKPGNYDVEVELFEDGKSVVSDIRSVTLKENSLAGQSADILLTDMDLIITQFTDRDTKAVVDVSPGIYNQGGDSKTLTMIVSARTDSYTAYNESDELGIIKGSSKLRGHVRYVLPRKADYKFSVTIEENGREVVTSEVPVPVNMSQIERNANKNYPLVEKGTPIEAPNKNNKTPGFEGSIVCAVLLLTACIIRRKCLKNKKDDSEGLHGQARR